MSVLIASHYLIMYLVCLAKHLKLLLLLDGLLFSSLLPFVFLYPYIVATFMYIDFVRQPLKILSGNRIHNI